MRKFYSLLMISLLFFLSGCSVLEHDDKGMMVVQLNSESLFARLNSEGASRGGDFKSSVNYKAELTVHGKDVNYSSVQNIQEKKTLSFTVPGLPVNTFVSASVKITDYNNELYYYGETQVIVHEGVVPVEITLKYVGDDPVDPVDPVDPIDPVDPVKTVSVEFVKKLETFIESKSYEAAFAAKAILSDGTEITEGLEYSSSNPDVVSIDAYGNVTAGIPGTATITVSYQGLKDSVTVTVLKLNSQDIAVDVSTFKLVSTIDMESIYSSDDEIPFVAADYLKVYCFASDTEEYDFETDRVFVDEWIWTFNGKQIDAGVGDINEQYISFAADNLNYEGKNIVQCTARRDEQWYEAVFLFTIEKNASRKLSENPVYFDLTNAYDGNLVWFNADSGESLTMDEVPENTRVKSINQMIDGTVAVVFETDSSSGPGKNYLRCYKMSEDGKPVCIKNGSNYYNSNLANWFDSENFIMGKLAQDPVTGKIWFFGYDGSDYLFVGTTSLCEDAEIDTIDFRPAASLAEILVLDESWSYIYAVCDDYILISSGSYRTLVFRVEGNSITYEGFSSSNPTGNDNAVIKDMQVVKSASGTSVYMLISASNGDPSSTYGDLIEYGCVKRIDYDSSKSGINAFDFYVTDFNDVGLSTNKDTKLKLYYDNLNYQNYFGPTEEESESCFYNPVRFVAVREDAIFVEDDGFYKKEDSEPGSVTNKDRIMKVSLKDKTISVVKDGIIVSLPSSAPSSGWKIEY